MERITAVITGGTGFVGSHLADFLLKQGWRVICLIRSSSDTKWLRGLNIELITVELTDIQGLQKAFHDADYIFHLAGIVKARNYAGYHHGNVKLTECILTAALAAPRLKRLLITSSLAAVGATTQGYPHTEETTVPPFSDYGKSKQAQEQAAHLYYDRLPITIIRPPVVYGTCDTELLQLFKTMKRGILPIVGSRRNPQTISVVYVQDLARGFYMAALSEKSLHQTYFIGGDKEENTTLDMGNILASFYKKRLYPISVPIFIIKMIATVSEALVFFTKKMPTLNKMKAQEIAQASWACSSEKAKRDFGYIAQTSLEKGIPETLQWYEQQGWL
jgi:nucleoside-diphosphate-sugar epimerase